ncbi:putative serine/threonine-protein kinase [Psilocybe cubensis]|uniref:Serine/threonine-protein kinase n=1 Tax=Psilocybe cubensis TaxID=181762 RepID=A0ACB8GGE4_PSICU|nr:putative serine/threonine-protein kinase [Psilocybe cubensis]KAH9474753.1 putative serine/threonine-protein kinase [Psilocybe cubensis]
MPQQIDQGHKSPRAMPHPGPLALEARDSLYHKYAGLQTLAQVLSTVSSATPSSFACLIASSSSSSSSSAVASTSSSKSYPLLTINSPTSPNFGIDLSQTNAFDSGSGSGSGPSSSAPACSTSSSSSSSSSHTSSIWGVCSRQRALDTQLRGHTLYTDEPEETLTPKQLTFPSSAGGITSNTSATAEEAVAVTAKATTEALNSHDSARLNHHAPTRPSQHAAWSRHPQSSSSNIGQGASSRTSTRTFPRDSSRNRTRSDNNSNNARLYSTADEALERINFYGSNSLLPTYSSASASACSSSTGYVSRVGQTINAECAKGRSSASGARPVQFVGRTLSSSIEGRAAQLSPVQTQRQRQPTSQTGGFKRRFAEKREAFINVLDAHLVGYQNILPPHIVSNAEQTPKPLHGFAMLKGHSIAVRKVRDIGSGNGTARIETVRSVPLPASISPSARQTKTVEKEMESEFGLKEDSIWALKRFRTRDVPFADGLRARSQLKSECEVYRRIAEAPKVGKVGFEFVMELVAAMTFRGEHCLLMPLMATDLADVLDSRRTILPRSDTRRIVAQIAIGLATLHSIGVIHSDLKPANVLFTPSGTVKLGDFGLSYRTPTMEPLHRDTVYSSRAVGTRGYMAPEKVLARGYSYPVDYWALGCIFAEMVGVEDRMLRSFDECSDVMTWEEDYGGVEDRRAFFEDQELDEDSLSLVCGLLDPNPQTRFGILELIAHPFFMIKDDVSEFGKIGKTDPERFIVVDSPSPSEKLTPAHPIETSDPTNDTMYHWINPYGPYVLHS